VKANAAIGNDGFSFQTVEPGSAEVTRQTGKMVPTESETLRINSVGTVVIEDDVEIGACSCIDRATLHETRIARGTKIDNLVQIAHNVQVGRKCVLVSMAGIAGSVTMGDRVVMAAAGGYDRSREDWRRLRDYASGRWNPRFSAGILWRGGSRPAPRG